MIKADSERQSKESQKSVRLRMIYIDVTKMLEKTDKNMTKTEDAAELNWRIRNLNVFLW